MEKEKIERKRESGVIRVVGGTPEDERKALEYFKSLFEKHPLDEIERDKTLEELKFIEQVNKLLPSFVKRYGGEPIEIPAKNIHIVDVTKLSETEGKKYEQTDHKGFYASEKQIIAILPQSESKLEFALTLVHEMLHFNSFNSFTQSSEEKGESAYGLRRQGLGIGRRKDGKAEILFEEIDEAVIMELTKRFDKEFFGNLDFLEEDIKRREQFREEVNTDSESKEDIGVYFQRKLKNDQWQTIIQSYSYAIERRKLKDIVNELYDKNRDSFNSPDEIFTVFTKAVFTGRLLPLSRLVEKTFGKGSFREIGESSIKQ